VSVSRAEWQRRVDELTASLERGEIEDARWFAGMTEIFEGAYLAGENPRAQSGFGGTRHAGRRHGGRSLMPSIATTGSSTSAARAATCSNAWSARRGTTSIRMGSTSPRGLRTSRASEQTGSTSATR